jgi:hypothetical protein
MSNYMIAKILIWTFFDVLLGKQNRKQTRSSQNKLTMFGCENFCLVGIE